MKERADKIASQRKAGKEDKMKDFTIVKEKSYGYPMGATMIDGGVHFSAVFQGNSCNLVLYLAGRKNSVKTIAFSPDDRTGDVWNLTIRGEFKGIEYAYEMDGILTADPYGKHITGREVWGNEKHWNEVPKSSLEEDDYDWKEDKLPEIPYENCVIYRLHPRGFTYHASSKVENRGTFLGVVQKIPYLKELGITTVELLPSIEFEEVMIEQEFSWDSQGKMQKEQKKKINYWGFIPGFYFSPKSSYCSGKEKHPAREFKDMVRAFHQAGMEVIMDLFFSGQEAETFVLDVVRFWAVQYHVDGFHFIGYAPARLLGSDPYLSRIKLLYSSWEGVQMGKNKHLAEYNDGFSIDMRRLLKGDEGQLNSFVFRNKRNPENCGVINYMANINTFTMMDNVCYDAKHNEANGENNQDGTDYNYSWNCGVEGPSRKKKVVEMRRKFLRNSWLLLLLSQGTPLILAGDEFGNSQGGNNNPYCQDNETSWLNWHQTKSNQDILDFVKAVLRFRKAHPVFHMAKEPNGLDYRSYGQPDVSYHGVNVWRPEFEHFRRQLGIMYCGDYGKREDGSSDNYFYVAYNMHWEPHEFALPNLPKGLSWHIAINTDQKEINGIYPEGEEVLVEKQKQFMVQARSIVVFIGKERERRE